MDRGLLAGYDALGVGVAVVGAAGLIVHVNLELSRMLAQPRSAFIGQSFVAVFGDLKASGASADPLAALGAGRAVRGVLPGNGSEPVAVEMRGARLGGAPPDNGWLVVTVCDLSDRNRHERDLHERYQDIARLSDTVLEQALALKSANARLEEKVRQRTAALHEANMEAIYMLAVAAEAKDDDTGQHVRRIEGYSRRLARACGLADGEIEQIGYSAILHDVGKIHIPDAILKKEGPLTPAERAIMQSHTLVGERILSDKPFFQLARQIARSHHENWDGSGYPDGTRGNDTPLPARIVHLVDVFDALTSARVYKNAWTAEQAMAAVFRQRKTAFDPQLVETFARLFERGALHDLLDGATPRAGAPNR